jgi:hypothetical protein
MFGRVWCESPRVTRRWMAGRKESRASQIPCARGEAAVMHLRDAKHQTPLDFCTCTQSPPFTRLPQPNTNHARSQLMSTTARSFPFHYSRTVEEYAQDLTRGKRASADSIMLHHHNSSCEPYSSGTYLIAKRDRAPAQLKDLSACPVSDELRADKRESTLQKPARPASEPKSLDHLAIRRASQTMYRSIPCLPAAQGTWADA